MPVSIDLGPVWSAPSILAMAYECIWLCLPRLMSACGCPCQDSTIRIWNIEECDRLPGEDETKKSTAAKIANVSMVTDVIMITNVIMRSPM